MHPIVQCILQLSLHRHRSQEPSSAYQLLDLGQSTESRFFQRSYVFSIVFLEKRMDIVLPVCLYKLFARLIGTLVQFSWQEFHCESHRAVESMVFGFKK
jgi:hypothetical protein